MHARNGGLIVDQLTKSYGSKTVVEGISFTVPTGTVAGFVGPNGSGKSTTLRMMIGHARPDSGRALFDGSPFPALRSPGRTVGVLLDAAAQHPGRSVVETAYLAGLMIGVTRKRVLACLEAVGVESVAKKRVGALSLGMRQRLGIAIAVLGAPRFLILDEPANGLDPEGIQWLRQFLRGFADHGGTVVVSSHQLSEVAAAADSIVVIDRGRLSAVGVGTATNPASILVRSSDDVLLHETLSRAGFAVSIAENGGLSVEGDAFDVGRVAFERGILLGHLAPHESSLEEAFLAATHGEYAGLGGERLLDFVRGGGR
ncbi:ABC-2 type transport system ATP-binding protein [Frondihabitans sp. PhB188]|nr:ABC-2 type transport system ATP-binding protein [Frondihabitans sp. PhB188]